MPRVVFVNPGTCGWTEIRQVVQDLPTIQIVGETRTAHETQNLAEELIPDYIIIPDRMGNESSLPLLRSIHARCRQCRAIVLATSLEYVVDLDAYREIPLAGYLAWDSLPADTFQACLSLAMGGALAVLSVAILDKLRSEPPSGGSSEIRLTSRERKVVQLIAEGYPDHLIAERMSLGVRTVERIVSALKAKLHAAKRADLCVHASQLGLLADNDEDV